MGYYKNFDELCKRLTKLTLPQYGKITYCNIVRLYKIDPVHENPVLDIFVSDTFNFVIWIFEWFYRHNIEFTRIIIHQLKIFQFQI